MIQIFSNTLGDEEKAAISRVIDSRWIGPGPECKMFEAELAQYYIVPKVLLTNSATSALYLALRCMNMRYGHEVIIPTIHFVATASAVMECGGIPVFADVDPHTLNIKPGEIERLRTNRTAGVIVNHYGGHPCDLAALFAEGSDLWLIEDAANAPASRHMGVLVGTLGNAGVWSFDSMKILSMADGGCLYLSDPDDYDRAWRLRNLGLDAFSGAQKSMSTDDKWWSFNVEEPSGKFDSNDLLACIGRVQLHKLHQFVARRKEIWDTYQRELANVERITLPPEPLPGCESSYYLYWIQLDGRDMMAKYLRSRGIYTTFRYYPLHYAFNNDASLPNAERAAERTLCLPIHQNLSDEEVTRIVRVILEWDAV